MDERNDLVLVSTMPAAEHVPIEDGLRYLPLEVEAGGMPARFAADIGTDDPPWHALVFGLETDRFGMRERVLAALRRDAAHEHIGRALGACFRSLYGGRGGTHQTAGFHDWLLAALRDEPDAARRRVLAHGLVLCERPEASRWLAEADLTRERGEDAPPAHDADVETSIALVTAFVENDESLDEPMWEVEQALRALALADRRRASDLACAILERCDPDELADAVDLSSLARQLAAFPTLDAMLARLDEDGVTALARDAASIATLEDVLRARGRLLRFDCETGHVPASHPEVLYWLAELAGITDAHFEQDVEEDGDDLADGLCYTLRAYFRGNILTGPAENCGDFYDVHACIGMVNSLARQARHPWRVAAIGAPDQVITVVAAPGPALHRWRATGLLAFEPDGNE